MSPGRLTDELIRVGRAAGLDAVGVCRADPFEFERVVLESRRAAGLAGGMQFTYRNPARSTDPAVTLRAARSLVVGARRYLRAEPESTHEGREIGEPGSAGVTEPAGSADLDRAGDRDRTADPDGEGNPLLEARVARYSWIDHYAPLRDALDEVAAALVGQGFQARVLVDDNALVDRAAAVRAGLGWYGNNANVLLPGAGSWFVLGSVVTDAELVEPDRPSDRSCPDRSRPDRSRPDGSRPGRPDLTLRSTEPGWGCGSCRRCLDACPTGALTGPGVLDARRCLAWLLQAPGMFPREHRAALGDRLYGCDDCQEVCPINKLGARRDPPAPAEAGAQIRLRVLELLASSDDELLQLVGRWYIPGREARYIRRNALVILGNSRRGGDPPVAAALRAALADPDPLVRAHAVWAARSLGRADLLEVVAADTDPLVLDEMASGGDGR